MRTMGKGLVDLHSPQGFAAETTSAAAILASAHMGFGLSTTQVCSGSVIGSGAGRRLSFVRWGTARRMMYGWLLTLPSAALFGAVAAAVALTGPFGVVIVLVALLVGTTTIVVISRRTAVNRHNVNDSRDVTVRVGRGSSTSTATAGTRRALFGSAESHRRRPDDIGPIVIRQTSTPSATAHSTSPDLPS
jgi:PiT family inorganic phosphate transporter